jgi:hypothetical protein
MGVRTILGRVAALWRALEEAQRAAWMAAAKEAKSNSRLGQNGTLTDFRVLGTCPVLATGSADITSLYAARYGVPPVARKVYLRGSQFVEWWESVLVTFWAIVLATA